MNEHDWQIAESATNWECGWEDSERFHLRCFRALSITDKLRAVEEMAEVVEYLQRRAQERRRAGACEQRYAIPGRDRSAKRETRNGGTTSGGV